MLNSTFFTSNSKHSKLNSPPLPTESVGTSLGFWYITGSFNQLTNSRNNPGEKWQCIFMKAPACVHTTLLTALLHSPSRGAAGKPRLFVNYAQILLTSTTYFVYWESSSWGYPRCTEETLSTGPRCLMELNFPTNSLYIYRRLTNTVYFTNGYQNFIVSKFYLQFSEELYNPKLNCLLCLKVTASVA